MANYLSSKDGYSVEFRNSQNKIVIGLPQTPTTATNTMYPIEERKTNPSDEELASILSLVRLIFKENQDAGKE